jgi:hypothetical protein
MRTPEAHSSRSTWGLSPGHSASLASPGRRAASASQRAKKASRQASKLETVSARAVVSHSSIRRARWRAAGGSRHRLAFVVRPRLPSLCVPCRDVEDQSLQIFRYVRRLTDRCAERLAYAGEVLERLKRFEIHPQCPWRSMADDYMISGSNHSPHVHDA